MPRGPKEGSSFQTVDQGRDSGRNRDWIDVIGTFAMPVVVLASAIVGGFVANSFQGQIAGTTLLSQREQAESQLRASMFSSLIEPVVGPKKGALIPLDREQLLVELLALNFHEHFELKPLFERVDQRLALLRSSQARESRESLRSIVRRIIDRQIAMFLKEGARNESNKAKVYSLRIIEHREQLNEHEQKYVEDLKQEGSEPYKINDVIPDLTSPDQTYRLAMVVSDPKWGKHEFKATIYECPPKPGDCPPQGGNFRVWKISPTWADLPLTDNTLFTDQNRFSVAVYRVSDRSPEVPLRTAWLKFIWFPRNYITPRERPIDYGQVFKLVGRKME